MSQELFVLIMIGLLVVAGVAVVRRLPARAPAPLDALRAGRAQPIGTVDGGAPAKIIGTAQPTGKPLVAPLSGRECVAWEVTVEASDAKSHDPVLIRDQGFCDFGLEDESGRALVKPERSRLAVEHDERYSLSADSPRELTAFLEKHGQSTTVLGFMRNLVFSEGVVGVGEEIAVLGTGRWETDPDSSADRGYRDRQRRLVMTDEAELPLTLSDDFRAFR